MSVLNLISCSCITTIHQISIPIIAPSKEFECIIAYCGSSVCPNLITRKTLTYNLSVPGANDAITNWIKHMQPLAFPSKYFCPKCFDPFWNLKETKHIEIGL